MTDVNVCYMSETNVKNASSRAMSSLIHLHRENFDPSFSSILHLLTQPLVTFDRGCICKLLLKLVTLSLITTKYSSFCNTKKITFGLILHYSEAAYSHVLRLICLPISNII